MARRVEAARATSGRRRAPIVGESFISFSILA
jgi:hypothetical protein